MEKRLALYQAKTRTCISTAGDIPADIEQCAGPNSIGRQVEATPFDNERRLLVGDHLPGAGKHVAFAPFDVDLDDRDGWPLQVAPNLIQRLQADRDGLFRPA